MVEFNKQVLLYIKTQIVEAWQHFPDIEVISAREKSYQWLRYREIKYKDAKNIYFTIFFNDLLTSERIMWIDIFVTESYMELYDHPDIKEILKHYPKLNMIKKKQKDENWIYLAEGEYILTEAEFSNLKETVIKKIEDDQFLELFKKLNEKLKELSKSES